MIEIIVNSDGIGVKARPYIPCVSCENELDCECIKLSKLNAPLPTYTQPGEKAAAGSYSAVEVKQMLSPAMGWVDEPKVPVFMRWAYKTRIIYRTIPAETNLPKGEEKVSGMEKLEIYRYQADDIQNALRLAARTLNSKEKTTSMDRDIMQAWQLIKNVLDKNIKQHVSRL